jgi:hypothetical protein
MNDVATAAADIVWAHWRDGRLMPALPEPVRPRTRSRKRRPASGPSTLMCRCPAVLVAAIFQPKSGCAL